MCSYIYKQNIFGKNSRLFYLHISPLVAFLLKVGTMDVSTELFIKICQPVIMDGKDFLFLLTTVYVVEQHSVVKGFLEHMPEITQYTFYMAIHALAFVIFCHQDFKTRLQTFYIIATI